MVALVYVLEPIMEPIPALESIPFWKRFHAIPILVLLATIPFPVPVAIITPLKCSFFETVAKGPKAREKIEGRNIDD